MPLVSVIIPIYNASLYLSRCVNSVISQTFKNLEVILVDDGSTDGSSIICDHFQQKDARIHVFHNNNSGVSASRNFGIQHAKGDYITFIDSDDWVEPEFIETLLYCFNDETDFSICNFTMVTDPDGNKNDYDTFSPGADNSSTIKDMFMHGWIFVIGILFRTDFLHRTNLLFPRHINYTEDIWFLSRAITYSSGIQKTDKRLYNYNLSNPLSITHLSADESSERIRLQSIEETIDFLKHHSLFESCKKEVYWRILVWKTWVARYPEKFSFFNEAIAEANRFICSNPLLSWRMKLLLLLIDKRCFLPARILSHMFFRPSL